MAAQDYFLSGAVDSVNEHLLSAFDVSDDGDEWGNCMAWFFATAHVLYHLDEVPEEWNYSHAPYCDEDMRDPEGYVESEIVYRMQDCGVTVEDLIEFGHMLNNLDEILKAEGKAY